MAELTAALVREQNVTFVVALVKDHVLNSTKLSDDTIDSIACAMQCPLVVLMGERSPKLRGNRRDVVDFVSTVGRHRLPWKKWSV